LVPGALLAGTVYVFEKTAVAVPAADKVTVFDSVVQKGSGLRATLSVFAAPGE
jgi:hypothetical protein